MKSAQLLFRCWLWAMEGARDNVFNSIVLFGRLLTTISINDQLECLPLYEELCLLEVSFTGLWALASIRYSERSRLSFLVPQKLYASQFLLSPDGKPKNPGVGLGIFMRETLISTMDNHKVFFQFFEKFVTQVEVLAGHILQSNIISTLGDSASTLQCHQVERSGILCILVLINSVLIAHQGKAMDKHEMEEELMTLPRLPLGGNLSRLAEGLLDCLSPLPKKGTIWLNVVYKVQAKARRKLLFKMISPKQKRNWIRYRLHKVKVPSSLTLRKPIDSART